jgi:glycerol-3-phosphate acyltransferase PlsY
MNALSGSARADNASGFLWSCLLGTLWLLWSAVRLVTFSVLAVFEPIVRCVLSLAAIGGFLTTALFYFAGPRGLAVSYGILLALSAGCAVALFLYEALLRALARKQG